MSPLDLTPIARDAHPGDTPSPVARAAMTFDELYERRYAPMVRLAHTLVDSRQRDVTGCAWHNP